MRRSATWPWGRIAAISFVVMLIVFIANILLDLPLIWSFISGALIWFSAYSMGRQEQTEAFGIRMIEFIKDHHERDDSQPWT